MQPVEVEVISPLPEGWGLCLTCEAMLARAGLDETPYRRSLEEYPPEWQEDFRRLSAVVLDLAERYGQAIVIRIWDPRSWQGLFKSLRYGVHQYPTFIVGRRRKIVGCNAVAIEEALSEDGTMRSEAAGGNR